MILDWMVLVCYLSLSALGTYFHRRQIMKWLFRLIQELRAGKYRKYAMAKTLPAKPTTVFPLPDEASPQASAIALVVGGLSLIGDEGYICRTVTLMMGDERHLYGWSLTLGHPDYAGVPYFFDTAEPGMARGIEIPNTMAYFQAAADATLARKDAPANMLDSVFAYVLPHISDDGPPPVAA